MKDDWKGLNLVELIDLLEPVSEPAPISMMPQTIGWLWLALILSGLLSFGFWKALAWRKRSAYRREALAELKGCSNDPSKLADLLRRTALAAYAREDIAALHGEDWLAFLDKAYGGHAFSDGPGRVVAEAPYKPSPEIAELKGLVRTWIKSHRVEAT